MDWPADFMASQLAQEWEDMMRVLSIVLTWTTGLGILAVALGGVIAASCPRMRRRSFWCPSARRDVEVLVDEAGPLGFRQTLRILECSVFEPASSVACRRGCRDATRRHPSAPPGLRASTSSSDRTSRPGRSASRATV